MVCILIFVLFLKKSFLPICFIFFALFFHWFSALVFGLFVLCFRWNFFNCLILFLDSLVYLVGILVFVFLGFVFMTFVCDVCFFAFLVCLILLLPFV